MAKAKTTEAVPAVKTFRGTGTLRTALLAYSKNRMGHDPQYKVEVLRVMAARDARKQAEQKKASVAAVS